MHATTEIARRAPERSLTWPQTLHVASGEPPRIHKADNAPNSAVVQAKFTPSLFEEDLESNPENHFLSTVQMYEYDDWADDSDSDAEEVEWDAGITDFALFDDECRRAKQSNQPLPSKWSGMLSQQTSALERAVQRSRTGPIPDFVDNFIPVDEVPSLTPDVSPNLRDDLDLEPYQGQRAARPSVPNYLTILVTPPEDDDNDEALEEDDEPLSFYVARRRLQSKPKRKPERPGLRHTRTMSGHVHAWRRPSMYTVGEDSEAEERAERGCNSENENESRSSQC